MFDIGWSEIAVIAVVALVAIGPKELPGVLRTVGQWMGKARKMAAEFQGQFQEAMREAEMADLKKSFDDVREVAGSLANRPFGSLQKSVTDALRIDDAEKPMDPQVASAVSEPIPSSDVTPATTDPVTPAASAPETSIQTEAHAAAAAEPLTITPQIEPEPAAPVTSDVARDAKAS